MRVFRVHFDGAEREGDSRRDRRDRKRLRVSRFLSHTYPIAHCLLPHIREPSSSTAKKASAFSSSPLHSRRALKRIVARASVSEKNARPQALRSELFAFNSSGLGSAAAGQAQHLG